MILYISFYIHQDILQDIIILYILIGRDFYLIKLRWEKIKFNSSILKNKSG